MKSVVAFALACAAGACTSDNTGAPGNTCDVVNDNCTGDTLCLASNSTCAPAFPRTYELSELMESVPTTKPDGTSWDIGGGAPDLFVVVSVDGTTVGMTPVVQDAFTASWQQTFTFTLNEGSTLDVNSWDSDVTANDPVLDCRAAPITIDNLRTRTLGCQPTGYSLTFTVLAQ